MFRPKCVSIIIRALNEAKHVGRLLKGIQSQSIAIPVQTILVDSGSTDNTVKIARSYDCKIVHIRPEDFSFGRAINVGVEAAEGEVCLLISAHCFPQDEMWLERMIQPFEDQDVGLVFGKQRGVQSTKFSEHAIFAKWFPSHDVHKTTFPFCNNANSALRKSLWLQHRFDEVLTGLEDIAWAKTIIEKGFVVSYQHQASVYHVHEESYRTVYRRYYREALAYRRIFHNQHFHFGHFLKYFSLNIFGDTMMAIKQKCFFREVSSIVKFRFMQFWGTYRGYGYRVPVSADMAQRMYYPRHPRRIFQEQEDLCVAPPTPGKR
ncbi:MAG: glycosyltransferase family 2 protein [Zetaproteobacteria bacterium]|nr:glycosyltransferase family 2 protein [Zetaproteobacteria bacterium]